MPSGTTTQYILSSPVLRVIVIVDVVTRLFIDGYSLVVARGGSGTPRWHPTASSTFGGTDGHPARVSGGRRAGACAQDTTSSSARRGRAVRVSLWRLGLRGAGRAAGSATPSITLAFAAASRCASISLIISIPRSICSVVIAFTPPDCSTCISRGTNET